MDIGMYGIILDKTVRSPNKTIMEFSTLEEAKIWAVNNPGTPYRLFEMKELKVVTKLIVEDVNAAPMKGCSWCLGTGKEYSSHLRMEIQCGACNGSGVVYGN